MLCFVLLVVIIALVTWLSWWGFPDFVVRYAERKAAEQGIYVKIENLLLSPGHGLAVQAKGVSVLPSAQADRPLATAQNVIVGVSVMQLIVGKVQPTYARLEGGKLELPVAHPSGKHLCVSNIQFTAASPPYNKGVLHIESCTLNLHGIAVAVKGNIDPALLPESDPAAEKTLDLPAILAKYQDSIDRAYGIICEQQWQDAPPALTIMLGTKNGGSVAAELSVPSLDLKPHHVLRAANHAEQRTYRFRSAKLSARYAGRVLTVDNLSFTTVEPEGRLSLAATYDIGNRHLVVSNLYSNVALTRMTTSMTRDSDNATEQMLYQILRKLRHADDSPPTLSNGRVDICFGEKEATPENAADDATVLTESLGLYLRKVHVSGKFEQKNLTIGNNCRVDNFAFAFLYMDGNFSIDEIIIETPESKITASARGRGRMGEADIAAHLSVPAVLKLIGEFCPAAAALPSGLELGPHVDLQLHATLKLRDFMAGARDWHNYIPRINSLDFHLSTEQLSIADNKVIEPEITLQMSDIHYTSTLLPDAVDALTLELKSTRAHLRAAEDKTLALSKALVRLQGGDIVLNVTNAQPLHRANRLKLELAADEARLGADAERSPSAQQASVVLIADQFEAEPDKPLTLGELGLLLTVDRAAAPDAASTEKLRLRAELNTLRINADLDPRSMSIDRTAIDAQAESLAAAGITARALKLAAEKREQLFPFNAATFTPGSPRIVLSAQELLVDESEPGGVDIRINAGAPPDDTDCAATLCAEMKGNLLGSLECSHLHAELRPKALEALMKLVPMGADEQEAEDAAALTLADALQITQPVQMNGSFTLALTPSLMLKQSQLQLEAPGLVRTACRQPALRGKSVPLSLSITQAHIEERPNRVFTYKAAVLLQHGDDTLAATVAGSSAGQIRMTGSSSIRADVADVLADYDDAHAIIRDFRFPHRGRSLLPELQLDIDYSHGLRVRFESPLTLEHTEYVFDAMEVLRDGTERLRSDLGSNPFTYVERATCRVKADVVYDATADDGSPLPDVCTIVISDADLHYNNTAWLKRHNIPNGTASTGLKAKSVIIDVEKSFVELADVSGTIYPSYSLGMFYPPLIGFLSDVKLQYPVRTESKQCVFPIYSDCRRPMSGNVRVISDHDAGYRFLGTIIPLQGFSGFVSLSDDYVLLDRLNARTWEGVLNAAVKIGFSGKKTTFDGYANARCMNLKRIAAAYNAKQDVALCSGEIRFRSSSADINDLEAYGHVDIEDGHLMTLSIFRPVSALISDLPNQFTHLEQQAAGVRGKPAPPGTFGRVTRQIFRGLGRVVSRTGDGLTETASFIPGLNHFIAYDLQEAHSDFDIVNGHLISRNMNAKGCNLDVQLNLDLDLNTLNIKGNLWPRISSLPTILLSPITFLSDFVVDINVSGPVSDLNWSIGLDKRAPSSPPSAVAEPSPAPAKPKKR